MNKRPIRLRVLRRHIKAAEWARNNGGGYVSETCPIAQAARERFDSESRPWYTKRVSAGSTSVSVEEADYSNFRSFKYDETGRTLVQLFDRNMSVRPTIVYLYEQDLEG